MCTFLDGHIPFHLNPKLALFKKLPWLHWHLISTCVWTIFKNMIVLIHLCILMPVDQGYMKTACFWGSQSLNLAAGVCSCWTCVHYSHTESHPHNPLTAIIVAYTVNVSWTDRLVLISTVCIIRDKAFINELLPSGLNTGFLSGTSVTMDNWTLIS